MPLLVVDDDGPSRRLLSLLLRHAGYRVVEASDPESAWDCIKAERPRLVILDILMPNGGGVGLAHRLHADPELQDIPLIAVSAAHDQPSVMDAVKDESFTSLLAIPVRSEELLKAVSAALPA